MQVLKGPADNVIQLGHSKTEAVSESCADKLKIDREPSGVMWSRCKLRERTEKNKKVVEAERDIYE